MKRTYTDEERETKRAAERELQQQAVEDLRSSEGWQRWLTTRSRFHRYSVTNQLLIAAQVQVLMENGWVEGTPVRVAGFGQWIKLGYSVSKRPEGMPKDALWGIKIWAPVPPSKKQLEEARVKGEKRPRTFFRLTSVFADNQVQPLPPPADPKPIRVPVVELEGDDLEGFWGPLVDLGAEIGSEVTLGETGTAEGFYDPSNKAIVIKRDACVNGRVHTLIHELAHALVRADKEDDDPTLNRAEEELVVESVAMSVTGTLGFDVSGYAIPYLTSWSQTEGTEILESAAKLVNRLCNRIEAILEPEPVVEVVTA